MNLRATSKDGAVERPAVLHIAAHLITRMEHLSTLVMNDRGPGSRLVAVRVPVLQLKHDCCRPTHAGAQQDQVTPAVGSWKAVLQREALAIPDMHMELLQPGICQSTRNHWK